MHPCSWLHARDDDGRGRGDPVDHGWGGDDAGGGIPIPRLGRLCGDGGSGLEDPASGDRSGRRRSGRLSPGGIASTHGSSIAVWSARASRWSGTRGSAHRHGGSTAGDVRGSALDGIAAGISESGSGFAERATSRRPRLGRDDPQDRGRDGGPRPCAGGTGARRPRQLWRPVAPPEQDGASRRPRRRRARERLAIAIARARPAGTAADDEPLDPARIDAGWRGVMVGARFAEAAGTVAPTGHRRTTRMPRSDASACGRSSATLALVHVPAHLPLRPRHAATVPGSRSRSSKHLSSLASFWRCSAAVPPDVSVSDITAVSPLAFSLVRGIDSRDRQGLGLVGQPQRVNRRHWRVARRVSVAPRWSGMPGPGAECRSAPRGDRTRHRRRTCSPLTGSWPHDERYPSTP